MAKRTETVKMKEKSGEIEDRQYKSNFSGFSLFTVEFYKKNSGKYKSLGKGNEDVKNAWYALSESEKKKYDIRARAMRAPPKERKSSAPFHTRCVPNQFIEVCTHLKKRKELMRRLTNIGFDKLVNLCCHSIPRHLCAEFIRAFDPPTKKICIRGKTLKVQTEDVHKVMGIPCNGKEIKAEEVKEEDEVFKQYKSVYSKLRYKTIASLLMEPHQDGNFEFLFVLYTLGTLLCPGSSVEVSDRILKVMVQTENELANYNWSSYVFNELCKSIGDYKRALTKGKVKGKKNVGGCLYFLMIYCFQRFPLAEEKASNYEAALGYWDDSKVHERVKKEKESSEGLLHMSNQISESDFTHPEIRRTYKRLVSMIGEELMDLQLRLMEKTTNIDDEGEEGEEEEEEEEIQSDGDNEMEEEEEEDKGEKESEQAEEEEEKTEHNSQYDEGDDKIEYVSQDEGREEEDEEDNQDTQEQMYVRRSTRARRPAIVSPWVITKTKAGKKRTIDQREALYQWCTTRCKEDEVQDVIVDMFGYHLTRAEVYCLRHRAWINDRVMSMVAKTLVGDQLENYGRVKRHIFSADFMSKMVANPLTWSCEANEKEILPQYVGYNIGDADFIFGPALFMDHWFCYVLETKTMRFYALDSLVEHANRKGDKRGKKKGDDSSKEILANHCVCTNFVNML